MLRQLPPLLRYASIVALLGLALLMPTRIEPIQPQRVAAGIEPAVAPAPIVGALAVPLSFEANQGQVEPDVAFLARGQGYSVKLRATDAVVALTQAAPHAEPASPPPAPATVRLRFVGASPDPVMAGLDRLPGTVSYFVGSDPAQWRVGIPTYTRVGYHGLYPGIDLVYYGNQRRVEYDLTVAPGADPSVIALRFEGAADLRLAADGELVMRVGAGDLRQPKPVIYQELAGGRRAVGGRYTLTDAQTVGFQVEPYDTSQPLVIDPVLVYGSTFGGPGIDGASDVAVDAAGNTYIVGRTNSGLDHYNAFVVKVDPTGTNLLYTAFYGGDCEDTGRSVAVDAAGNAYFTGQRTFRDQWNLCNDHKIYVAKLNAAGDALHFDVHVGGGDKEDSGHELALDAAGNVYVTGRAMYLFPTTPGAYQPEGGFPGDAFISRRVVSPATPS